MPAVDLWYGKLIAEPSSLDGYLYSLLSPAEKQRAQRLHRTQFKHRFTQTRGRLRLKLAEYLHLPPADIKLATDQYGKPYIADRPDLSFNLSHSGDHLILGIAFSDVAATKQTPPNGPTTGASHALKIGVDIEAIAPRRTLTRLVKKCLTEAEIERWSAMSETERTLEFYRIWTCKEAFVKATGRGLALGLTNIEIVSCNHSPQLLQIPSQYGHPSQWRLAEIRPEADVLGAVCINDCRLEIQLHNWNVPI